jgi:hypothetical protein
MSAVDYVLELDDAPDADLALADERFVAVLSNTPVALMWNEALRLAQEADDAAAEDWPDAEDFE